jgi:hypothetical protein
MNTSLTSKSRPVMALFLIINILVFTFKSSLIRYGFDIPFLLIANVLLFLLSLFGFYIQTKGVQSANVNAFVRGLYSSLLLKMFVIVAAIFIYIFVMDGHVNKPSLFTSMAIYLVYTFIEVTQLMKIARKKNNAG